MKFKKLLFTLSSIAVVAGPALPIVACKKVAIPPAIDNKFDISDFSDVQPYQEQIRAVNYAAITGDEINAIFYKAVNSRLILFVKSFDLVRGVDYKVLVKTGAGVAVPASATYNLTNTGPSADRSFLVTVESLPDSNLLEGASKDIPVTLPLQLAKESINTVASSITVSNADYTTANFANPAAALPDEIITYLKAKVQTLISAIGGAAATADIDIDYTVLVQTTANADLSGTYNLPTGTNNFNVTVIAQPDSMKLTGGNTTPFSVAFPA